MAPLPLAIVPALPLRPYVLVPIPERKSSRPRDELQSAVQQLEDAANLVTGAPVSRRLTSNDFLRPLTGPGRMITNPTSRPASTPGRTQSTSQTSKLQAENDKLKREIAKIKATYFEVQKNLVDIKKGVLILQNRLAEKQKKLEEANAKNDELAYALESINPGGYTKPRPTNNPLIGSFNTQDLRPDDIPSSTNTKHHTFSKPHPAPPGIPIGLTRLDLATFGNIRISAFATNLDTTGFDINLDGDQVNSAGCIWLETEPDHQDFQHGVYSTLQDHPWRDPSTPTHQRRISFQRPYSDPPQVIVWLNSFNLGKDKNWRLKTYASDITATGFTIHIAAWGDTELFSAGATWIAYPTGRKGVASGSFNTKEIHPDTPDLMENSKTVAFPKEAGFTEAPGKMVVGISGLNMACGRDMRLVVRYSELGSEGATWHLDAWADTVLYSASGSYVAIA